MAHQGRTLLALLLISLGLNIYFIHLFSAQCIKLKPILYPDPLKTPGAVFTEVSAQDICDPGYSARVRNVPKKTKKLVFERYGIPYPQPRAAYELDHFISLELGGSNEPENLWPEAAEPRPGFNEKDVVENYLHDQVCDGKLSIKEAQGAIQKDWYAVYQKITYNK